MNKQLLSVLLALSMAFAFLPSAALADDPFPERYDVWVGGVQADITNEPIFPVGEDGFATYDHESKTLTLTDVTISAAYAAENNQYGIYAIGDLNLVLVGANTVTAPENTLGNSCAIYVAGHLTISGSGTLTASGGNVTSDTNYYSCGIYATDVTINDGTVTASGGQTAGGTVYSIGLYGGSLTVNDGIVAAVGGTSTFQSYGAITRSSCTVNGGFLTATGDANTNYSHGLFLDGTAHLTINGGKVIATGGLVNSGFGVLSLGSPTTISGGTLTASGNTAAMDKAPTYSGGYTVAASGNVNGTGAAAYMEDGIATYKYLDFRPATEYDLWVGNAQVTSAKTSGNGWSYTPAADGIPQTLTLADANITTAHTFADGQYGIFTSSSDLNLVLSGISSVVGKAASEINSYGIKTGGDLNISGSGSLTATGGMLSGIFFDSCGMDIGGDLTVSLSGSLTATGGYARLDGSIDTKSYGIRVAGTLLIENGNLSAIGLSAHKTSAGISSGAITIRGGTVTATGGADSSTIKAMSVAPAFGGSYAFGGYQVFAGASSTNNIHVPSPIDSTYTANGYVKITPAAYAVTYRPGANGTGGTATDNKVHDTPLTLSGALFARGGFTQTGWALADGATKSYDLSGSYTANASVELFPVWTQNASVPPAESTVYNNPSQSYATIWLSGSGLGGSDLLVTEPITKGGSYNAMLKLSDSKDILNVYDIFLKSGKSATGNAMYLTFDLTVQYAGQSFTLVHKKADGTFEYLYATAGADGKVKFGPIYELSPFMLVKGTLLSGAAAPKVPNTGDFSALPIALLFLSALCGVGASAYRKKRS